MTPQDMETLAAQGRYWWMKADGTFYAIGEWRDPASSPDTYLLDAYPGWIDQWGSWEAAVDALAPMFALLDEHRNKP